MTDDDLYELTHKRRFSARLRALNAMGIEYRVRPDRTLAVCRAHVDAVLSGRVQFDRAPRIAEPNWSD